MSTNEIDIVKLSINDTFYDWFLRTNQVIDYVNPINVYDVFAGAGILESRTGTPGTIELSISTKSETYAIDTLLDTGGVSTVALNYNDLTIGTVVNTTKFGIQGTGSQIFRVAASDMLPPTLHSNHTFTGTITVADLIVNDGTITLNNTMSTSRDNCGLMIESKADNFSENVYFTYDVETEAWYSSENLGVKSGKAFVTDSSPKAIFPFQSSSSQGQIDVRLQSIIGGVNERFSIEAEFDAGNSLTFSHYLNNILVHDVLELTSNGTAGSEVIVKDIITITDVINSNPFTQTPVATNIPITDSTNGYLNTFVNRIKLPKGSVTVGEVVRMGSTTLELATPTSLSASQSIGIVESLDGSNAVVITSGPFSGITGLSGFTIGDVYYLDPTVAGGVTNTDPNNTNGILDKPVFIATSANGGVLIPDFTSIGGGTVISGGGTGTVNNAFKTISVDTETLTASGEDNVIFSSGTFIDLDLSGDVITANCTIANARPAYSIWSTDASGSLSFNTIPSYSIPARTLTGTLSSVTLTPGTLLGRRDDTDDTDNPVQALSGSEVLSLLGFSGNKYIKNILFEGGTGTDEFDFDADNSESISIRAGDNISFEYLGGSLYIHSAGLADTTNLGGSAALIIATEGDPQAQINRLIFEDDFGGAATNATKFIEFSMRTVGTNSDAFISAKPTNNYLRLSGDGVILGSHTAGKLLKIQGDTRVGTTSTLSTNSAGETFIIGLSPMIIVDKIKPLKSSTGDDGLILSGDSSITARNTVKIIDSPRNSADNKDEYTMVINGFDDTTSATPRVSTYLNGVFASDVSGLKTKCVSLYADASAISSTTEGDVYSYPFRLFELVVDKLHVNELNATTAIKLTEYLSTVIGTSIGQSFPYNTSDICMVRYKTDTQTVDNPSGVNGVGLTFFDDVSGAPTPYSYIIRPSAFRANILDIPASTFIVSDHLSFGSSTDADAVSPYLSRGAAGRIDITSDAVTDVSLRIRGDSSAGGEGILGCSSIANGYLYLINNSGGNTAYLQLNAGSGNSIIKTDTLTITDGSNGIKFETDAFASTAADNGKVMFVNTVASGVATMKSGYIVKPLPAGAVPATDPINTLYYTVVV
jgi:stage V sporulation protein SpoVS